MSSVTKKYDLRDGKWKLTEVDFTVAPVEPHDYHAFVDPHCWSRALTETEVAKIAENYGPDACVKVGIPCDLHRKEP